MAKWSRDGDNIIWKLENGGWAWIDHVTMDNIDCIIISNEMITICKNGIEKANAIKGYVDEVGFYEYDDLGREDETSRRIVFEH